MPKCFFILFETKRAIHLSTFSEVTTIFHFLRETPFVPYKQSSQAQRTRICRKLTSKKCRTWSQYAYKFKVVMSFWRYPRTNGLKVIWILQKEFIKGEKANIIFSYDITKDWFMTCIFKKSPKFNLLRVTRFAWTVHRTASSNKWTKKSSAA